MTASERKSPGFNPEDPYFAAFQGPMQAQPTEGRRLAQIQPMQASMVAGY